MKTRMKIESEIRFYELNGCLITFPYTTMFQCFFSPRVLYFIFSPFISVFLYNAESIYMFFLYLFQTFQEKYIEDAMQNLVFKFHLIQI